MKSNIILIVSIIVVAASVGFFIYQKNENKKLDNELVEIKADIEKVKTQIEDEKNAKIEKESDYEKLKEEIKDKLEELDVWEKLEQKLNTALSS